MVKFGGNYICRKYTAGQRGPPSSSTHRRPPPQSPVGHARDFPAFVAFVEFHLAKFVRPTSARAYFRRLFVDFPPVHEGGFHRLLHSLEHGEEINLTTDGSKLDNDEASAGWLFWRIYYDDDEDEENDEEDMKSVDGGQ